MKGECMTKSADAKTRKIVQKDGKWFIVFGKEPETIPIESIKIVITKNEDDEREDVYVKANNLDIYIKVGEPTVIPMNHYKVLMHGNLKDRVQVII